MEEIIVQKNKTNKKVYVNSTIKICSIPDEELNNIVLVYSGIIQNLISKSMKRKQYRNNKKKVIKNYWQDHSKVLYFV